MKERGSMVAVFWIGRALLAIPLLLLMFDVNGSDRLMLICLPIGLGLSMWVTAEEIKAKFGVVSFSVGLALGFLGMVKNLIPLSLLGSGLVFVGVMTWAFFKS